MKKFGIYGDEKRSDEIREVFRCLNCEKKRYDYNQDDAIYFLDDDDLYGCGCVFTDYWCNNLGYDLSCVYTIYEFKKLYPYKVGDRVLVTLTDCAPMSAVICRFELVNEELCYKVFDEKRRTHLIVGVNQIMCFADEKGSVETKEKEYRDGYIEFSNDVFQDEVEFNLGDYEIVVKDGKTFAVRKSKYPKTYTECCEILGFTGNEHEVCGYKFLLLEKFQRLLLCRDAYWKLAGDWKPDWNDCSVVKYVIGRHGGEIYLSNETRHARLLAFPTEEMRDAFYKDFKERIEGCKELI